uniref:Uncharacterized protein LOC114327596 n=1 Tax=Diabrotica virgifera virgifera TaxID=50390 RepID=A0A6P7F937_DIAVI
MTPSNVEEMDKPVGRSRNKKPVTSYETSLLEMLKAKQNEEINEDKHFPLMLVPMMGRLNDDQKHYAKIEILNVMQNAANYITQPPQPAFPQSFQHHHDGASQAHYTGNKKYRQSQNTESLQQYDNNVRRNVLSPSSASDSDVCDMSNQ